MNFRFTANSRISNQTHRKPMPRCLPPLRQPILYQVSQLSPKELGCRDPKYDRGQAQVRSTINPRGAKTRPSQNIAPPSTPFLTSTPSIRSFTNLPRQRPLPSHLPQRKSRIHEYLDPLHSQTHIIIPPTATPFPLVGPKTQDKDTLAIAKMPLRSRDGPGPIFKFTNIQVSQAVAGVGRANPNTCFCMLYER